MRIKNAERLKVRKIGSSYMIVGLTDTSVNMTEVFTMNESAACLMEHCLAAGEFSVENLSGWLVEAYGIDPGLAGADACAAVEKWRELGLLLD